MKQSLGKYITYISETNRHWVFKCPFCGDSPKKDHGHLYVSKTIPVFRCVKCGQGGHIKYLLDFVNAHDIILPEYIDNGFQTKHIYKKKNIVKRSPLDDYIKEYVNNRFKDINIITDWDRLNILSLSDYKKILNNTDYNIYNSVVPFLTSRGKKIIGRLIGMDKRYYNYSLDEGYDCYSIQNERNYSSYFDHKTIVIGEGIFDILHTYFKTNLFNDIPLDSVFVASHSKSMTLAYKYAKSIALTYTPNVIVLADNDTSNEYYIKEFRSGFQTLKIYRNRVGKDFGEQIIEPLLSYHQEGYRYDSKLR